MFTKEELQELQEYDRKVDEEERLRQNELKRKWKKSTPEIHERVKQANRDYYWKNRDRIRAKRKARWYGYEKNLVQAQKKTYDENE